jgi:hypothetical protein
VSLLDASSNVLATWNTATGVLNGTFTYTLPSAVRAFDITSVIWLVLGSGTMVLATLPVQSRLNRPKPPNPQGTYYVSVKSVGQGADPTVGFSSYGSIGTYSLTLPPPFTTVTCTSSQTIQLTGSGGCSSTAALLTSALYTASGAVTVSPALPSSMQFTPGDYSYTVAGADGVNSCVARLSVKACPTLTCAALSVQLPQSGVDCSGAVVASSALYTSSAAVTVTPALQSKYSPGAWVVDDW